jgi:hypothetical protein
MAHTNTATRLDGCTNRRSQRGVCAYRHRTKEKLQQESTCVGSRDRRWPATTDKRNERRPWPNAARWLAKCVQGRVGAARNKQNRRSKKQTHRCHVRVPDLPISPMLELPARAHTPRTAKKEKRDREETEREKTGKGQGRDREGRAYRSITRKARAGSRAKAKSSGGAGRRTDNGSEQTAETETEAEAEATAHGRWQMADGRRTPRIADRSQTPERATDETDETDTGESDIAGTAEPTPSDRECAPPLVALLLLPRTTS